MGGPGDALPDDAAREEELAAAALDEVAMALAMEGKTGDPGQYRDHVLAPPPVVS